MIKKHAYLLQQVGLLDGLQHVLLGRLLGLSAQQELIQDEVCLLKVEDNIQLAHLWGHNTNSSGSEILSSLKTVDYTLWSPHTLNQRVACEAFETYTSEIFVQQLYISVDDLQSDELVILILHCTAEIQTRISETWRRKNVDQQGGDVTDVANLHMYTGRRRHKKSKQYFIVIVWVEMPVNAKIKIQVYLECFTALFLQQHHCVLWH